MTATARQINPQPPVQYGLLDEDRTHEQEFNEWVATKYGGHIMRLIYRLAVPYGERYLKTGRRVSMKLIFELIRDRLPWIRAALVKRGITPTKDRGFALNNVYSAYAARHVETHRKEFAGMFEKRATKSAVD